MLGTPSDQIEKAEHDLLLSDELLQSGSYLDWCLICLFYFALHCVNAHASSQGITSFKPRKEEKKSEHGKRIRYVNNNMRGVFAIYNRLFNRSVQCRYDPQYFKMLQLGTVRILFQRSTRELVRLNYFPKNRVP